MTKMKKHNFAQGVFCKDCGNSVSAAWAESYDLARAGHGLCDECYEKANTPAAKIRKTSPALQKVEEKKDDDAVGP